MADESGTNASDPEPIPFQGRVLGVDYGTKRIGIAVTDVEQRLASPLHNYDRRSKTADADFLRQVVADHLIVGVVVGLPVHMSGDEGGKAKEARRYGKWLRSILSLPVVWHDERFSSLAADRLMMAADLTPEQQKKRRDKLAAQILLQAWIDTRDV